MEGWKGHSNNMSMVGCNPITNFDILKAWNDITTCLSAGTDWATKKSCTVFLKSIIMARAIFPAVKMGAFVLVGLTVAAGVDMACV
jgi:hypothetical protein